MDIRRFRLIIASIMFFLSSYVNAVPVTEQLNLTVNNGAFVGAVATGSFTYDDALIFQVPVQDITPMQGLTINLNAFGQTFTELNDVDYPAYPALRFLDGVVSSLDFFVDENFNPMNPTAIIQEGVYGLGFRALTRNNITGEFDGQLFVNEFPLISTVPVPAAAWLFGSALLAFFGFSKARKKEEQEKIFAGYFVTG